MGEGDEVENRPEERRHAKTLRRDEPYFGRAAQHFIRTDQRDDDRDRDEFDPRSRGVNEKLLQSRRDEVAGSGQDKSRERQGAELHRRIEDRETRPHQSVADRDEEDLPAQHLCHESVSELVEDQQDDPRDQEKGHTQLCHRKVLRQFEKDEERKEEGENHEDAPLVRRLRGAIGWNEGAGRFFVHSTVLDHASDPLQSTPLDHCGKDLTRMALP